MPDDGQFHVVQRGDIVYSSKRRETALRHYRKIRDEMLSTTRAASPLELDRKALLEKAVAEGEVDRMLIESARAKRANATYTKKSGGKWRAT